MAKEDSSAAKVNGNPKQRSGGKSRDNHG